VEEVLAAIDALDLDAPWPDIAPAVRLVLPRLRPLPEGTGTLPVRRYPPGLSVGLGLDIGPAMVFIGEEQLDGWGVTPAEAFARAEANLRERCAARRHFGLVHERIGGVPTIAFRSTEGWAAALVLFPELLARVLGEQPGLVLAPMRDLVMWLPLDADRELVEAILEEFALADMNALALPVFAFVDGRVSVAAPAGPGLEVAQA
jgi:hypothetical protein